MPGSLPSTPDPVENAATNSVRTPSTGVSLAFDMDQAYEEFSENSRLFQGSSELQSFVHPANPRSDNVPWPVPRPVPSSTHSLLSSWNNTRPGELSASGDRSFQTSFEADEPAVIWRSPGGTMPPVPSSMRDNVSFLASRGSQAMSLAAAQPSAEDPWMSGAMGTPNSSQTVGSISSAQTDLTANSTRTQGIFPAEEPYVPSPLLEEFSLAGVGRAARPAVVHDPSNTKAECHEDLYYVEYRYERPRELRVFSEKLGLLLSARKTFDSSYAIQGAGQSENWYLSGQQGEALKIVGSNGESLPPYHEMLVGSDLGKKLKDLMSMLLPDPKKRSIRWSFFLSNSDRGDSPDHPYNECSVERYHGSLSFWVLKLRDSASGTGQ